MAWVQRLQAMLDAAQPAVFTGPDGRTYVRFVSLGGIPMVLPAEPRFEVLASHPLGEKVQASPAVADNRLFIRGEHHLFCIGR